MGGTQLRRVLVLVGCALVPATRRWRRVRRRYGEDKRFDFFVRRLLGVNQPECCNEERATQ
jgi:hypothetical protein